MVKSNAGCAYMASGVIINTLLDWASKESWDTSLKLLALSDSDSLISWIDNRNYSNFISQKQIYENLSLPLTIINERINEIRIQEYLPTTQLGLDHQQKRS